MGEQRNLTKENVVALKAQLDEMQKDNPDLEYRFFEQEVPECGNKKEITVETLFNMLKGLERKIDFIFDGHVLVNGDFIKTKGVTRSDINKTIR